MRHIGNVVYSQGYQGFESLRLRHKNQTPIGAFYFCVRRDEGIGQSNEVAHDQYADEQLANLQKRIYLIEFLRLGLIIVYQGQEFVSTRRYGGLIYVKSGQLDGPEF